MKKTIAILSLLLLLLLPLCLRADTASTTTVSNIIHSLVFALAPGTDITFTTNGSVVTVAVVPSAATNAVNVWTASNSYVGPLVVSGGVAITTVNSNGMTVAGNGVTTSVLTNLVQSLYFLEATNAPKPVVPAGYAELWCSNGFWFNVTAQHANGVFIVAP